MSKMKDEFLRQEEGLAEAAPELLAVLEESARARHECEVRIDAEWGAPLAERHEGHKFEDCPQQACAAARAAIERARATE